MYVSDSYLVYLVVLLASLNSFLPYHFSDINGGMKKLVLSGKYYDISVELGPKSLHIALTIISLTAILNAS